MLVRDWMSTAVITVEPGTPVSNAIDLLDRNQISLLPVVQDQKLVGIVTQMDLKPFAGGAHGFIGPNFLSRITVRDVMSNAPLTIPDDLTVEEAADALLKNDIPGVAVVNHKNQIVGVITQTDINRVMVSVTGLMRGGIVLGFLLEDSPGSIKGLTDIMRAFGGRLASILTSYERVPKGYRRVHIRVRGLDRSKLPELKRQLSEKAILLYKVDQRENTREIYVETGEVNYTVQRK